MAQIGIAENGNEGTMLDCLYYTTNLKYLKLGESGRLKSAVHVNKMEYERTPVTSEMIQSEKKPKGSPKNFSCNVMDLGFKGL